MQNYGNIPGFDAVQPSYEKLIPQPGESFRCFNRRSLKTPAKWHHHPEIELTYIERGSGSRLVGDHIGSYGDGDLVLLGSELPHTWLSDAYRGKQYDRHPALVVQFHPQFLGRDFFAATEWTAVSGMLESAQRGLWFPPEVARPIGSQMNAMIDLNRTVRLIRLLECLHELTQHMDQSRCLASHAYPGSPSRNARTRIQLVCNYIEQELSNPELDHAALAKLVSMNPSAFSRFFKKATGRTVTAYITELRIGLACRLLADTNDPILEISLRAGFGNLSNFNRRFRALHEMAPRQYRALHRAGRTATP